MNGLTEDQEFTDETRMSGERFVWECAVGGKSPVIVPSGGDFPMRQAVEKAFFDLTGKHPEMCYSGWGRKFTDKARAHDTLATDLAAALDREAAKGAELARWKRIAWTLRSFATHDDDCKVNKPPHYRDCSCGLQSIIAGMDELHRATLGGPTQPTEYERKLAQLKKDFPNGI